MITVRLMGGFANAMAQAVSPSLLSIHDQLQSYHVQPPSGRESATKRQARDKQYMAKSDHCSV